MKQLHFNHKQATAMMGLAVMVIIGFAGLKQLNSSQAATACTVSATLVDSCRPWLGGFSSQYPQAASDFKSQILYHEQRIGRQLDVVHNYHPVGSNQLSSGELYFANRPDTIVMSNWKPANTWSDAAGGNATVNAAIDQMADSIKSAAPHKIMLTLYHEPEDNVTSDPNCPNVTYKGSAGTPTDYRNMWANVQSRFAAQGVTNVVWVMNYMGYSAWDCLVKDLWPGNSSVDWVTWDPYYDTSGFAAGTHRFYDFLTSNSDVTHDFNSKPWGLNEWGAVASLTQAQTYAIYDGAKAALDADTFPKLKLYDIFDTINPTDFRTLYNTAGVLDQTEQDHYNAFANDDHFTDTEAPTPTPTATPTPTPTPTPCNVPGDINGDCHVNSADLAVLLRYWSTPSGATRSQGDLDGNGTINSADLARLLSGWGT